MNNPSRWLARKLPLVFLLAVLALLRAEQGVAEVKGTAGGPSRLLHLTPEPGGHTWALSLLGHQLSVPSPATLLDQLQRISESLREKTPAN